MIGDGGLVFFVTGKNWWHTNDFLVPQPHNETNVRYPFLYQCLCMEFCYGVKYLFLDCKPPCIIGLYFGRTSYRQSWNWSYSPQTSDIHFTETMVIILYTLAQPAFVSRYFSHSLLSRGTDRVLCLTLKKDNHPSSHQDLSAMEL